MKLEGPDRSIPKSGAFSLVDMCHQAMEFLDAAVDLPVDKLEWQVDKAEITAVKLRDRLIELLRKDIRSMPAEQSRWREPLDHVNVAISLITGVEYPSAGIHRERIGQAKETLDKIGKMLPDRSAA
jgi:hypothetical protein